jgi:pentapeptide MXKDX repeat protein
VLKNEQHLNMDSTYDHQMFPSKSKCWYSNNCLHFKACCFVNFYIQPVLIKMTGCKMSVDKMSVDKTPVDKMSVDKMSEDKMSEDKMSVDKYL